MIARLLWLEELRESFQVAADEPLCGMLVGDTVDPLKKRVLFVLSRRLPYKSFNPFQILVHSFAKANDCAIEKVRSVDNRLIIDILTKRRIGPPSRVNPFKDAK